MFPVDANQSQGDNELKIASCTDTSGSPNSSVLDIDLEFLDSQIVNENWNKDLQNLNMASTEVSLDLSTLLEFNNDFSSDIPFQEQSYDLNSISELITDPSFDGFEKSLGDVPAEETTLDSNVKEKKNELSTELAGKKYLEMRRKNNIASQRSRKIRKRKDSEMADKLKKLEKENKDLLLLSQKLEEERDMLKSYLMTIIARKK